MEDRIRAAFADIHADRALVDDTLAYVLDKAEKPRRKREGFAHRIKAWPLSAAAVLIVLLFSYNLYFTAAAYVSMDVNPLVELTLNRFDRVIGTYAFNDDGASILIGSSLSGKSCAEAALSILSAVKDSGYIERDSLISVTVQAENSEKEQALCESLQRFIGEETQPAAVPAELEVFPVSQEIWESARGCNMSPAKFMAIQALMKVDESATLEAYADSSIRQIRQRIQDCGGHRGESGSGSTSDDSNSMQGHGHGEHH